MRKYRLFSLILVIALLGALAVGCGQQTAAPVEVDEDAIILDAAKAYFANLPEHKNIISPADLNGLVDNSPDSIYIIDIRAADDYAAGHISGAVNIAWGQVGAHIDSIPAGKTVIVACYSGQTAGQTVAVLKMAGFDVRSLKSGMNNGSLKAELPVVTD